MELNLLENFSMFKASYSLFTEKVSEKYNISKTEFDILMFLSNNPQYDTAAKIVEMRHLAKSHVSVLLTRLDEAGYITRSYAAGNHKTVHIRLTDKAVPIIEEGRLVQISYITMLLDGVSDSQLAATKACLEKIRSNADKYLKENS